MSDQEKRAARRPWYVLGTDIRTSVLLTVLFGGMVTWRVVQFAIDPQVLDMVFVVLGLVLVLAGVISIVYYARKVPAK